VRMHSPMLADLDAWIAEQKQPFPTRPEAVRRLLQGALSTKRARAQSSTNTNPNISFEYIQMAEQFFRGYSLIPDAFPIDYAKYFLFCHAIEISLKAYLVHLGDDAELVKEKYGHNIKKLLQDCKKRGLAISADTVAGLSMLNQAHQKYWSRYPKQDWTTGIPTIPQFEGDAFVLFNAVSEAVWGVPMTRSWMANWKTS
jgi:hypothetical protein